MMETAAGITEIVASATPASAEVVAIADFKVQISEINLLDSVALNNLIASLKSTIDVVIKSTAKGDDGLYDTIFRAYYNALYTAGQFDNCILPCFNAVHANLRPPALYGILFTEYHKKLDYETVQKLCQHVAGLLEKSSAVHFLLVLKCINLFYSKYPDARIEFSLTKFYYCLQSQSSAVRDEGINFFRNWLSGEQNSREIFAVINKYWPWTNKYKFIFLGAILADHRLTGFLSTREEIAIFLQGVRLSLNYKNLFSAGQLVIKALSKQNIESFDGFLIDITTGGSHRELIYMNSQWMHYVQNKADLYAALHLDRDLERILDLKFIQNDTFWLVMLCTMFERQFYKHSQIAEITGYLQNNCFGFDLDTQLYVYKFLVGNLMATGIKAPETLQFVRTFIRQHLLVPCSEFRNTILGKLPLVLDYLAKKCKTLDPTVIIQFFADLKDIFEQGIVRCEYQALIFNLKMFHILLKCFASTTHKSLMKNSNVNMHKALALLLAEQNVWHLQDEYGAIFSLLSSSGDFDDVLELAVRILIELPPSNIEHQEFELWKRLVDDPEIDKCNQSRYYARLCVQRNSKNAHFVNTFFEYSIKQIAQNTIKLETDSLQACKEGFHIFGFFCALNELFKNKSCVDHCRESSRSIAVIAAENAVRFVLKQLNLAGGDETNASFQIMEESLEMIVSESGWSSEVHSVDRKFLLLSYWMTLKACCELTTSVGLSLVEKTEDDEAARAILKTCLSIHATILHGCRHKGAIETAGVSLGLLVKGISQACNQNSQTYKLLYDCFDLLFGSVNNISTTRRGAGLSIMFHNFIKNDAIKSRPLFQHAIKILLEHAQKSRSPSHNPIESDGRHDNFDALVLHYLCVLVRDSDLKDSIVEYYDEIMMSAIVRINDKEWAVRNGALQLFGALVPKIVGQKQSVPGNDDDHATSWEPSEITFTEFCIKLPKTNDYILSYCKESNTRRKSTASIILFLEFLSNIDYIKKDNIENTSGLLCDYRELFWRFLSHCCEKVRKLSSKCLARLHNFYDELPMLMLSTIDLIFDSFNENFVHGLIFFHIHGVEKIKLESQCMYGTSWKDFSEMFRNKIVDRFKPKIFRSYVKIYLLTLFRLVEFNFKDHCVAKMLAINESKRNIKSSRELYNDVGITNFGRFVFEEKLREMELAQTSSEKKLEKT